ncbi:SEL1-like repeat protein [Helicobacter sp. L8]|uniref:tetratricopeptide repeat protein n=1 Tax=Helicobacter sp. L8 TaxID=2316078 RepID=UPI000EAC1D88|nr:SEL1-like repeat protein [Helicobacter sp. L8]
MTNVIKAVLVVALVLASMHAQSDRDRDYAIAKDNLYRTTMLKALEYFSKLAKEGDARGYKGLGDVYYWGGRGVAVDQKKAFQNYQKAAKMGNVGAYVALAGFYECGFKSGDFMVAKNLPKALEYYHKAGKMGNSKAYRDLGSLYEYGDCAPKDIKKAIQYYKQSALMGNVEACIILGDMYESGREVSKDAQKAIEYYKKAGESGHKHEIGEVFGARDGYLSIADMYVIGEGVPQDDQKALEYYQKAYHSKADAYKALGSAYRGYGAGMTKDLPASVRNTPKALKYLKKAAELGSLDAYVDLGDMYKWGEGVPKDDDKAVDYYWKACDLGDSGACDEARGGRSYDGD